MDKNLIVFLPGGLHGEFFDRAASRCETPSLLIRQWIKAYLASSPAPTAPSLPIMAEVAGPNEAAA